MRWRWRSTPAPRRRPIVEIGIERLRAAGVSVTTVKGIYYDWLRDVATLARVRAQMGRSLPPGLTL